jgi:hypothetical protein
VTLHQSRVKGQIEGQLSCSWTGVLLTWVIPMLVKEPISLGLAVVRVGSLMLALMLTAIWLFTRNDFKEPAP